MFTIKNTSSFVVEILIHNEEIIIIQPNCSTFIDNESSNINISFRIAHDNWREKQKKRRFWENDVMWDHLVVVSSFVIEIFSANSEISILHKTIETKHLIKLECVEFFLNGTKLTAFAHRVFDDVKMKNELKKNKLRDGVLEYLLLTAMLSPIKSLIFLTVIISVGIRYGWYWGLGILCVFMLFLLLIAVLDSLTENWLEKKVSKLFKSKPEIFETNLDYLDSEKLTTYLNLYQSYA